MTEDITLLCFDYGRKRIGVAIGQTLTRTASPLCTIRVNNGTPNWDEISSLVCKWSPDALIVGKPLNMDGSGQKMTTESNRFVKQLQKKFEQPVFRMDERLSSYEAKIRKQDDSELDPIAAQVILETWLSEYSGKNFKDDIIDQSR